ncbi:unnamed protein product [Effrenium voratum]|nr:unnamed protein product [Effrenium voratum]
MLEEDMFLGNPDLGKTVSRPLQVRLPNLPRTLQPDAQSCQAECAIHAGCEHFTYWPDGGCLLHAPGSQLKAAPARFARSVTGPKDCPLEAASMPETRPKKLDPSLDDPEAYALPAQASAPALSVPVRVLAGPNGTTCGAYPACKAVQMEGSCCPNAEGLMLGCCSGFPVQAEVSPPGTECRAFSGCRALGLSGACCPTAKGVRLSCCEL